ncbi:MAG: TetR/AcrR family transcriptional regulator [Actinomycetota bacterium]
MTTAPTSNRYHHGDLPNALKGAAAEVIAERGPSGFSLREVARRAGVSHAAPAHHFRDSTGLLTELAVDAFRYLDAAMSEAEAAATDSVDRLRLLGRAYVEVAVEHPAHCSIVFRGDVVDTTSPDYQEWGERAYGHLAAAVEAVAAEHNPDLDIGLAASLCWSAMQGLIVLHPGMIKRQELFCDPEEITTESIGDIAERFGDMMMAGFKARP